MRKIALCLVLIGLAAALVGAGTFAYFSDTETSSGNTFTAGSLDLEIQNPDGTWVNDPNVDLGWSAAVNNLKPGDVEYIEIPVRNIGTVAGVPDFKFMITENSPGTNPEPEGTPDLANLADAVWVEYLCLHGDGTSCYLYQGPLAGLNGVNIRAHQVLQPGGAPERWAMYLSLPPTVGNEVMGDYVNFDIEFSLTQN